MKFRMLLVLVGKLSASLLFHLNCFSCYYSCTEFLLGEDILVAPIVEEGTIYRDIYIPKGIWIDGNDLQSSPIRGPTWLRNYKADLDVLPYFLRSQMEIYETKSTTTFIPRLVCE